VLIEVLARADAQREPFVADDCQRRGGLRDDRRVVADRGAGDAGGQPDPVSTRGDRTKHGPRERRVPLRVQPRMEMVADLHEVETHLLGPHGLPDQFLRREPLGDEFVTELHDRRLPRVPDF
jgi:hypothetical protein